MSVSDSVLIATPTVVYVAIASRAEFDKLNVPVYDSSNAKVLVKVVDGEGGVSVIFQHWLQ